MSRVVILGGGPAGCATALSLVAAGLEPGGIVVLEAGRYDRDRIGETIPPESRKVFAELGVLDAFVEQGHEPSHGSASAWGSDELGYDDFMFSPYGHGWHLDRRRFDAWLAAEVASRGVEVRTGVRGGGEIEHAEFVVDATGVRSRYARRMGARRREHDRLVCVSAFFRLPEHAEFPRKTLLEAVEYGWWYCARLPNRRIAVVVATSYSLFKQHRLDRPRAWLEALVATRHAIGPLAACEPEPGSLSVCTVPSFMLDPVHGDHWLAVGDAASAYDPISSQGIVKALSDGLDAGPRIAEFLAGDADALAPRQQRLAQQFAEYLRQRAYYYGQERRWPDATFWRSRSGDVTSADGDANGQPWTTR